MGTLRQTLNHIRGKTRTALIGAVAICMTASLMGEGRIGSSLIGPASAQQMIEIVVVGIETTHWAFPGAAFYSKPGNVYKSRMWLLNKEERIAARSGDELPETDKALEMLDDLKQEIEADGWRLVGRGDHWYSLQFSR